MLEKEEERNSGDLVSFFERELGRVGRDGVVGAASFAGVFNELMPAQKAKLEGLCGRSFSNLLAGGSIVSIGIAHSEHAIDSIGVIVDGKVDKARWNEYAREYEEINGQLDSIARNVAETFGGVPVPATLGGLVGKVAKVEDYYPLTISHRVVAEHAGLGWRGKNGLVVNERYGCALRFASIITETRFRKGKRMEPRCGPCSACLDACSILKNKDRLEDYRENCRLFIKSLGLEQEVCGKCVAACYRKGAFEGRFKLRRA